MKLKLLGASLLFMASAAAIADTYVTVIDNGTSSGEPTLATTRAAGSCVYADKSLKPGDTIVLSGSEIVLVCATAPQGAVFYSLAPDGAQRVTASVTAAAKAVEPEVNAYKITRPPAPAFTPVKAWDDGRFTFIELAKPYLGELPAVFALADDGTRSLVNWQWDEENSRMVVQQVLDRAVLVVGDKSIIVSRT